MFKHSYCDGVDFLRSALTKESPYRKFHRIPSKSNLFRAKSMFHSEFARWLFCARARAHTVLHFLSVAARGSAPPRFSPQVPLIRSHWTRAEGDGAETTTQRHDDVVPGVPCHHRAQGSSVNPFGYPPLSDIYLLNARGMLTLKCVALSLEGC